jgi:hypothetical protein
MAGSSPAMTLFSDFHRKARSAAQTYFFGQIAHRSLSNDPSFATRNRRFSFTDSA